ncbi:LapA family protein [Pseudogracilibacillus sp. ICA-222130]|uniref:LapA family protein n=1 Tax=Pseudogracilibacillus sp. ICA-222130 TaxID=3134655 RepID=UPI0030C09C2A
MKGQTYVILAIVFTIIISVFAVLNIDEVEVNYLFWSGSSPLIFVILFSVLLGGLLMMMVASKKHFQLKKQIKKLEAQLQMRNEQEIIDVTTDVEEETSIRSSQDEDLK